MRIIEYSLASLLWILFASSNLLADIYRWDNGELIRGTDEVELAPHADLTRLSLHYADLADADLRNSYFSDSDLSYADLSNSDLNGARFQYAKLTDASFSGSQISNVDFSVGLPVREFEKHSLTEAQLQSTASYQSMDLRGINLKNKNLFRWNFSGQDLTGARFWNSTLDSANFSDANLTGVSFSSAFVFGANFDGATLFGAYLGGASGFTRAMLESTSSYQSKDLRRVTFSRDLNGTDLRGQDLRGADLSGSRLKGVNLRGANLKGTIFGDIDTKVDQIELTIMDSTTVYNQWTEFPRFFDPSRHGLTYDPAPIGDFDGDDMLTPADLRLLQRYVTSKPIDDLEIQSSKWWLFDVAQDQNGRANQEDVIAWVKSWGTELGDTNLDKQVGQADFLLLSQNFGQLGGWEQGDFDSDGEVGFSDFLLLSRTMGYDANPPDPTEFELGDVNYDHRIDSFDFIFIQNNFGLDGDRSGGDINGNGVVDFADFLLLSGSFPSSVVAVPEACGRSFFWIVVFLLGFARAQLIRLH